MFARKTPGRTIDLSPQRRYRWEGVCSVVTEVGVITHVARGALRARHSRDARREARERLRRSASRHGVPCPGTDVVWTVPEPVELTSVPNRRTP